MTLETTIRCFVLAIAIGASGCTVTGYDPDFTLEITGFRTHEEMEDFVAKTAFQITGYAYQRGGTSSGDPSGKWDWQSSRYAALQINGDMSYFYSLRQDLTVIVTGGSAGVAEDDAEMAWIRAAILMALPEQLTVRERHFGEAHGYRVPERPAQLPPRPCPNGETSCPGAGAYMRGM